MQSVCVSYTFPRKNSTMRSSARVHQARVGTQKMGTIAPLRFYGTPPLPMGGLRHVNDAFLQWAGEAHWRHGGFNLARKAKEQPKQSPKAGDAKAEAARKPAKTVDTDAAQTKQKRKPQEDEGPIVDEERQGKRQRLVKKVSVKDGKGDTKGKVDGKGAGKGEKRGKAGKKKSAKKRKARK
eukprot:jgi/Mesvir1/19881/Mv13166-RA.1